MVRRCIVLAALLGLMACGLPRDPAGTLQRVRGETLRVGVIPGDPWVRLGGDGPSGTEVDIVAGFAATLDAQVEWVPGTEAELFDALEVRAVDLVVGGLEASDPWVSTSGVTRPYATTRTVVGIPEGVPAPRDLSGRRVLVERAGSTAGLVSEAGGVPVVVPQVTGGRELAAVDDWTLDDLGLADSGIVLAESPHVMAAPRGENAFLVELERYLYSRRAQIAAAIASQGPS